MTDYYYYLSVYSDCLHTSMENKLVHRSATQCSWGQTTRAMYKRNYNVKTRSEKYMNKKLI